MTCYIKEKEGKEYKIGPLLEWEFTHTDGTDGTDAFYVKCLFEDQMAEPLEKCGLFRCEYEGKRVFTGIIDDYETELSQNGRTVKINGRGMGGLLLDSCTEGCDYYLCTAEDILRRFVYPLGITKVRYDKMKPLYGFKLSTGDSCSKALSEFCLWSAETKPYFTPEGELVITKEAGEIKKADSGKIISAKLKSRRYGVISEIKVITSRGTSQKVVNEGFNGTAKKVITVPKYTSYKNMRYTGKYQIDRSMENRYAVTIETKELFPVFPRQRLYLDLPILKAGEYTVVKTVCRGNGSGAGTVITAVK